MFWIVLSLFMAGLSLFSATIYGQAGDPLALIACMAMQAAALVWAFLAGASTGDNASDD